MQEICGHGGGKLDLERTNVEHVFRVLGGIPAAARGVQAFKKLEEHIAGEVKEVKGQEA